MNDPKRFLDGGGTELEQILLASGRAARPKASARWKTEALVLLAALGFVAKAKAAAPLTSKAYAWALARYLAVGLGGGATVWGVAHVVANPSPHARDTAEVAYLAKPPAPAASIAPRSVETNLPDVPREVERPSSEPSGVRRPSEAPTDRAGAHSPRAPLVARSATATGASSLAATGSPAAPSEPTTASSIGSEVQQLDRARKALADGHAETAIHALDGYNRAFPKGVLQQEALRLRVEAFVASGDRATARSLASRFRTLYPNSPHAKRLDSIVDGP